MVKKSTQIRPRRAAAGSLDAMNGAGQGGAIEMDDDDEFRVLNSLNAEFNSGEQHDWLCRVFRLIPVPGRQPREGWLFDHNVAELRTLREIIAQQRGPGRYRARVIKDNIPFRQYDFDIEVDLRPAQAPLAAAPAATAPASSFEAMMLQMMENQNRFMQMLAERLTTQPAVVDESERMLKMAQTMKALQELNAPANIGLEMFKEGMNLMKDITPKGDGAGAGVMDLAMAAIDKAGPVLEKLLSQQRAPVPNAPRAAVPSLPPRSAAPANAPARSNAAAADAPAANGEIPQEMIELKNYLVIKAREGAQPELLADYVERQLGEPGMALLEAQDDPLMFLEGLFPDIVEHRNWFIALMDALWPEEEEQPPADAHANANPGELSPDTGRRGGDAGNP